MKRRFSWLPRTGSQRCSAHSEGLEHQGLLLAATEHTEGCRNIIGSENGDARRHEMKRDLALIAANMERIRDHAKEMNAIYDRSKGAGPQGDIQADGRRMEELYKESLLLRKETLKQIEILRCAANEANLQHRHEASPGRHKRKEAESGISRLFKRLRICY